jgi:hypothetical protein
MARYGTGYNARSSRPLRSVLIIAVSLPIGLALCYWLTWLGMYLSDERTTHPTTNAVRLGDFNGDGLLDAFYCNGAIVPNSNNSVMTNLGAGRFAYGGQRLGEASCQTLSLGDLDGDGDIDAAGSGFPTLMLYMNDGTGLFKAINWAYGIGRWTNAVGDLDGDGDLDILLAGCCHPEAQVLTAAINQGGEGNKVQGFFGRATWQMNTLGTEGMALGDLDGDGDLDAFIANREFTVGWDFHSTPNQPNMVAWNDGSGVFSDSGQRLGQANSTSVTLGDLDNDGDLDAFVGNLGPDEVWFNAGGKQGGSPGIFENSGQQLSNTNTVAVLLVDLDSDGTLDAVVTRQTTFFRSRPQIYLNDGEGRFTPSNSLKWRLVLGTAFDAADLTGNGQPNIFGAWYEDQYGLSR